MNVAGGGETYDTFVGTTIPAHTTISATMGSAYSTMSIDWTEVGGQTTFNFAIDQVRTGANPGGWNPDYAASQSELVFTATENATYSLSGFYSVTDVGSGANYVALFGTLYDKTANSYLLESEQLSFSSHDEAFVLGGTAGDSRVFNSVRGSLDGNLIAGHEYSFAWDTNTMSFPDADLGASATGNINLTITAAVEPVPAPGSLVCLLGIGVMVTGMEYWRKRRRKAGDTVVRTCVGGNGDGLAVPGAHLGQGRAAVVLSWYEW